MTETVDGDSPDFEIFRRKDLDQVEVYIFFLHTLINVGSIHSPENFPNLSSSQPLIFKNNINSLIFFRNFQ